MPARSAFATPQAMPLKITVVILIDVGSVRTVATRGCASARPSADPTVPNAKPRAAAQTDTSYWLFTHVSVHALLLGWYTLLTLLYVANVTVRTVSHSGDNLPKCSSRGLFMKGPCSPESLYARNLQGSWFRGMFKSGMSGCLVMRVRKVLR